MTIVSDKDEDIKCPESVPDGQIGVTEAEEQWQLKKEPRPPVPRWVFAAIAAVVVIAFLGGSWWYYRKNVLPEKYFQRADIFFKDGDYRDAYLLYERVFELRPERKGVLYQLGYCLEKTGKYDGAIARYTEHLKKMPGDAQAMMRLGWIYAENKNDGQKGMEFIRKGAQKLDDPYAWTILGNVASQYGDRDTQIEALVNQISLFKKPQEILTCAKSLTKLNAWKEALDGYSHVAEIASGDASAQHGIITAKKVLGYPMDEKHTIVPGESLGAVDIGATKEDVKKAAGVPDKKEFPMVGGKSMLANERAEIWYYGKTAPKLAMRVIFLRGKVQEIESASPEYKTPDGIGISNFMFAKNKDRFDSIKEARNSAMLYLVKGGGLTFYAYEFNSAGDSAKYKKFRVHRGETSIDNVDSFSLLDLFH